MSTDAVREIGPVEADGATRSGAYLLDVRELDEWAAGHAPAAHHIALGELSARAEELPTDAPIVVVCRSGARSLVAARALQAAGYVASNLAGGMQAWAGEGLDVVADAGPGAVI